MGFIIDLKEDHFILKNLTELVRVDQTTEIEKEVSVYTLSVRENHNFFVSDQDIFVHNFILISYFVGEGLVWAGAGEIFSVAAAAFIGWAAYKNGIDTRNFFPFQIQKPNKDNWEHHILKPRKHGFNGKDPKKIWNLTELAIIAAIRRNELENGRKFVTQYVTEYGTLEVVGKVVNNVVKVATAYIKGYKG